MAEHTADIKLVIANKNYSSWSMRAWVLLRELGIPFEEIQLPLYPPNSKDWIDNIGRYSPTRSVPVMLLNGTRIWDSLAIVETVAELFPHKGVWPDDPMLRAQARSLAAEMHAGFRTLRSALGMNIRASLKVSVTTELQGDITRVLEIWRPRTPAADQGPFLFGRFSAADAFYAPIVTRFKTYDIELPGYAQDYCAAIGGLDSVRAWIAGAGLESA